MLGHEIERIWWGGKRGILSEANTNGKIEQEEKERR
jgi:hypothetical protein